jgi:very-short-patch-repair endonuclease
MIRDQLINDRLASEGIRVFRIWEHDWCADKESVIRRLYAFCSLSTSPLQNARVG